MYKTFNEFSKHIIPTGKNSTPYKEQSDSTHIVLYRMDIIIEPEK